MTKRVGSHSHFADRVLREDSTRGVGDFIRAIEESDGSVSYFFVAKQKGYEGWEWCVNLFEAQDAPTVSEVLLLPSTDALQAPAWVPWSERLAEWKAIQAELEAQAAALEEEGEDGTSPEADSDDESVSKDDSEWADTGEDFDEAEDLATQELRILKEVSFSVEDDDSESQTVSATANLEQSKDSETDADDAGVRPPRLSRRNRFWGKKKNK